MCTSIGVCHGDITRKKPDSYTEEQKKIKEELARQDSNDCKMTSFYITNDGKYAIDSDYVDLDDLDNVDLDNVPKIEVNIKFEQ